MYMDCYLDGRFSPGLMLINVYGMLLHSLSPACFSACVYGLLPLAREFFCGKRVLKLALFFAEFCRFLTKFPVASYENLNFVLGFCIQAVTLSFSDIPR